MFDQNYYNYLASANPAQAAQYVAQFQQQQQAAAPVTTGLAPSPQPLDPAAPGMMIPGQGALAMPVPELARGTLEDFDDQRVGGGGPSLTKFYQGRAQGSWVHVRVTRDLDKADVRQQTDFVTKQPKFFKDRKPKFDLWVPVTVVATSDAAGQGQLFTEGTAMMYLKPDSGDGLKSQVTRALASVGNPEGLRSGKVGGTEFVIASAGEKPNPGRAATKLYQVQAFAVTRDAAAGNGDGPVAPPADPAPVPPAAPAVPPAPVPEVAAPAPAPAAPAPPVPPAPVPPVPAPRLPSEAVTTAGGETKEQLLARLSGASR